VHLQREGVVVPVASANGAPTSVSGPFRFSCTGKAMHLLAPAGGARADHAVDLPYCEGLEARRSNGYACMRRLSQRRVTAKPRALFPRCIAALSRRLPPLAQVLASSKAAPADGRAPPVPPLAPPSAVRRQQQPAQRTTQPPSRPPVVIDLSTFADRRERPPASAPKRPL